MTPPASAAGARVLYITYDGLTDFLGQSQVLPYLLGCAAAGHQITVISFEKGDRLAKLGDQVTAQLSAANIRWLPQRFRTFPPLAAKVLDMRTMARVAAREATAGGYDLVHCRSYPPAWVGLSLKRKFGLPLVFDMRGFWPDSRREGGRWGTANPLGRALFRQWKQREAALITQSDHIVTLTKSARDSIRGWSSYRRAPVSVIPCCADFELFRPPTGAERHDVRRELDVPADAMVIAYLGSLGTIYRLPDQLRVFAAFRRRFPGARMLFIGRNEQASILAEAARIGVELSPDEVRLVQAERPQVPRYLGASDLGLCFYTETFSSRHVSPTKMGEYLACGVPAFASAGLGDAAEILGATSGGVALPDFSQESIAAAVDWFAQHPRSSSAIRDRARPILDLPQAVRAYAAIYSDISRAVDVSY